MKAPKLWLKIGLILASVLLTLLLVEIVLRIFTPEPENLAKLKSSSLFLYENKPNSTFEYGANEFKVGIRLNSSGFRDVEFTPKNPAVFRIAVLGDSQEEALQVPLAKTWQKIMAIKLAEATSRQVETYNFGVSGYGTDQEWLTLREKVWRWEPDMVILAFSPNDVGDTYKNKFVTLKDGQIVVAKPGERQGGNLLGKAVRQTYLYHLVVKAASASERGKRVVDKVRVKILGFPKDDRFYLSDAQLVQGPFEVVASQKNPPPEVVESWKIIKTLTSDMKKQAESHGAQLLITVNIPRAQVDESDWSALASQYKLDLATFSPYQINESLAVVARENSISFYDPRLDAIAWKKSTGILHFPKDGHFNQNGHEFMGQKVAEFITSHSLVK